MGSNVTLLDKILANRVYFSIVGNSVKSVGYVNTTKMTLLRLGFLKSIDLNLNGQKIHADKSDFAEVLHTKIWAIDKKMDGIKIGKENIDFTYHGKPVRFKVDTSSEAVTNDTVGLISEQFFSETYDFEKIEGKAVVDIGANVGDSAIYFALNGAKMVVAFEPYPHLYEQARKNVLANKLEKVISLHNEGVGGELSEIRISAEEHGIGSSRLEASRSGKMIKVVTLWWIVKKYGLKDALLKSDCEGSEYGIIMNADDKTLNAFKEMIIEYHKGYLNLVKRLESAGFTVSRTRPLRMLHADGSPSSYAGMLRAKRNG